MKNNWVTTGAIFGFLGVAIGALGAHQVKKFVSPEMMEIYHTGVLYHLIHAAVILAIGLAGNRKFFKGALFISIGIVLFSFSLYVYSLSSISAIAMITPVGGIAFLLGWLLIIISSLKKNEP